eukprot:4008562-Lingulodinium_polyedra.AAC.1
MNNAALASQRAACAQLGVPEEVAALLRALPIGSGPGPQGSAAPRRRSVQQLVEVAQQHDALVPCAVEMVSQFAWSRLIASISQYLPLCMLRDVLALS